MRLILCTLALLFCCVSASGNSYIYVPLAVPKAEDVVLFTNGLPPGDGSRDFKKKQDILKFLRKGKNNVNVLSWDALEYGGRKGNAFSQTCDGVFTDKAGRFYFWFLKTPHVLKLETSEGETALIELK